MSDLNNKYTLPCAILRNLRKVGLVFENLPVFEFNESETDYSLKLINFIEASRMTSSVMKFTHLERPGLLFRVKLDDEKDEKEFCVFALYLYDEKTWAVIEQRHPTHGNKRFNSSMDKYCKKLLHEDSFCSCLEKYYFSGIIYNENDGNDEKEWFLNNFFKMFHIHPFAKIK